MTTIDNKKLGMVLSLYCAAAFVVCFFWAFTITDTTLRELHASLFDMSFLAYTGHNVVSFVSGLVQTYIWGWIIGLTFGWLWNRVY